MGYLFKSLTADVGSSLYVRSATAVLVRSEDGDLG